MAVVQTDDEVHGQIPDPAHSARLLSCQHDFQVRLATEPGASGGEETEKSETMTAGDFRHPQRSVGRRARGAKANSKVVRARARQERSGISQLRECLMSESQGDSSGRFPFIMQTTFKILMAGALGAGVWCLPNHAADAETAAVMRTKLAVAQ